MQWASFDYELIKPNLNELDNNHLDNILVFLNPKKKPITNQFDLKYGEKNSKLNNNNS